MKLTSDSCSCRMMKVIKFYIAPSKVISEVFFVKVLGNFRKAELIEKRRFLWNMEGLFASHISRYDLYF